MTDSFDDLWDVNPHLALLRSENYVSPTERDWLRWVAKVERVVGHSLDGDRETDGYSTDDAYDYFHAGFTADEYAQIVQGERNSPMACPGTMYNGPGKRFARCSFCHQIDYEANEGDHCRNPLTSAEIGRINHRLMFGDNDEAFPPADEWRAWTD